MKKYIIIICIILFMGIIYLFSNLKGEVSDRQSIGILDRVILLFDKNISDEDREELSLKLNYPLRKLAHIVEYFILCLLVCLLFHNLGYNMWKVILITFMISFIFACGDEIHQLFVKDRYGCFFDVLVDTVGIILFLIIYYFKERRKV